MQKPHDAERLSAGTTILIASGEMLYAGIVMGTGLGASYGFIISLLIVPFDLRIVPFVFTALGIGVVGAMFGFLAGLISGGITGFVVGIVTYFFFNPPADREQYRIIMAGLCAVCVTLLLGIGFSGIPNFLFSIVPAVAAGISAGYAGYRYASPYTVDKIKRKNDEKPKREEALIDR